MFRFLWKLVSSKGARWLGGVSIAVLGMYGTFFYERKPDLAIEVISSSNVLDIRESLTKLTITYDGTDLRATNQNLHLLVLRVTNSGSADILKSSFDEAAPLGFAVSVGKIVEAPMVVADTYLKQNLRITVKDDRAITFAPVILNVGESFQVRTLLLVPGNQNPTVSPLGKIAGIRDISVAPADAENETSSFSERAFHGDVSVQLSRLLGYTVALLLSLVVVGVTIGVPISKASSAVARSRRSRKVEEYRNAVQRRLSLQEEYLARQYVDDSFLYAAFIRIVRPDRVSEERHRAYVEHQGELMIEDSRQVFESAYPELEASGLIVRDGPQITVAAAFEGPAREFVSFVSPAPSEPA